MSLEWQQVLGYACAAAIALAVVGVPARLVWGSWRTQQSKKTKKKFMAKLRAEAAAVAAERGAPAVAGLRARKKTSVAVVPPQVRRPANSVRPDSDAEADECGAPAGGRGTTHLASGQSVVAL
jgi:hypothetical protein